MGIGDGDCFLRLFGQQIDDMTIAELTCLAECRLFSPAIISVALRVRVSISVLLDGLLPRLEPNHCNCYIDSVLLARAFILYFFLSWEYSHNAYMSHSLVLVCGHPHSNIY